jgi:hypothetical protein
MINIKYIHSEQFQNLKYKSLKQKQNRNPSHRYMTAHFPGLVRALQWNVDIKFGARYAFRE